VALAMRSLWVDSPNRAELADAWSEPDRRRRMGGADYLSFFFAFSLPI
jgi:hypothetical protein